MESPPLSTLHHQDNGGEKKQQPPPRKFFKSSSNASNRSVSMSDTELESFHSPLRSESPFRSDDPVFRPGTTTTTNNNKQLVSVVDKYFTPNPNPKKPNSEFLSFPPTPISADSSPVAVVLNHSVRDGVPPGLEKLERGEGRSRGVANSGLQRSKRELMVKKAALGFRLCEVILCLIAFSVMAADRTQGWSGDSFDRYKEYRYLVAVNVIGFVYAAFQACDLACYLPTGKHAIPIPFRNHFDFAIDQILAYLLMSASSSAATRVDDWVSNWGKDEFTIMASAAISLSFLSFFAFALSSLVCGYCLCNQHYFA